MVFIGSDGNVTEHRTKWRLSIVTDIFWGVANGVLLFFRALTTSPARITSNVTRSTYAQRQGIRRPNTSGSGVSESAGGGANIRGVRNLGTPRAMCGGGG